MQQSLWNELLYFFIVKTRNAETFRASKQTDAFLGKHCAVPSLKYMVK